MRWRWGGKVASNGRVKEMKMRIQREEAVTERNENIRQARGKRKTGASER